MDIQAVVTLPDLIYDIYADVAKDLGDCTVEQALSAALCAYARYIYEEMRSEGLLRDDEREGEQAKAGV